MRDENIQLIREACVRVNSELIPNYKNLGVRPTRLADVLLAMKAQKERKISDQYHLITGGLDDTMWNLRKDSLTDQSDECLQFLASLLTEAVKK